MSTLTPIKAAKYMELVEHKARLFSKDDSTKVCAIIVAPATLQELSSGYNGMPRGINEAVVARWERPLKYKWVEHAERNAVYNASLRGTPLADSIIFVNRYPCADCARAIIQSGIKRVITTKPESNLTWNESWQVASEMLAEAGILVTDSTLVKPIVI